MFLCKKLGPICPTKNLHETYNVGECLLRDQTLKKLLTVNTLSAIVNYVCVIVRKHIDIIL